MGRTCSHLEGGRKVDADIVAYGKKPPCMQAVFRMYQEVAFSELLFEVVALYVSSIRPLLSFYFSVLFHGQPEWHNAEHINHGLQFDAALDAILEGMKDLAGG
jgi:hypothetical protein